MKVNSVRELHLEARRTEKSHKILRCLAPQDEGSVTPRPLKYIPKHIFVEESETKSDVFKNVAKLCLQSKITKIIDFAGFHKENKDLLFSRDNLFIAKKLGKVIRPCPCAKNHLRCGYFVLSLGYGCPFACSYCYFQYYGNAKGFIIHSNIAEVLKQVEAFLKSKARRTLRLGTGEFSDSLALDHLSNYSGVLVPFFSRFKNVNFELKTKSTNIDNLKGLHHKARTVISWSISPQNLITTQERGTATLEERIVAAIKCQAWGYKLGFHFDPIILGENFKADYKQVLDELFFAISPENIAWISLGSLRFERKLKNYIEKKFPDSKIIYGELLPGLDGKLRYFRKIRTEIYRYMLDLIQKRSKHIPVYLCMETSLVWKEALGRTGHAHIFADKNS